MTIIALNVELSKDKYNTWMHVGFHNFNEIKNYDEILSIWCNMNLIYLLPKLPISLVELYCSNNPLKSLPELPNSLKSLSCHNNQLITLPEFPNSLNIFIVIIIY